MYEGMSFDFILKRLLSNNALKGLDTREGGVIYNALAPAASELAKLYMSLDIFFSETFADTASLQSLMRRAAERGIMRRPATAAIVMGEFSPAGVSVMDARFSCGDLIYIVAEDMGLGTYRLECETLGEAGNISSGRLIPLSPSYIDGLESARLTALLTPGENAENRDSLRDRYVRSLNPVAFGGNIADYREKVEAMPGVGGVKVSPVWNGGGTVKLTVITSAYGIPSDEQIDELQTAVDPVANSGKGLGIAPIGHVVTVAPVETARVDITTNITYAGSWIWDELRPHVHRVIDGYFLELAKGWSDSDSLVVRISQIESRLLELDGVLDVEGTTLNGQQSNFSLQPDEFPVRGAVSG